MKEKYKNPSTKALEDPRIDQAISDALDGYASDKDTWTQAYKRFYADLYQGVTRQEALNNALDLVERDAESSRESATNRFNVVFASEALPEHEVLNNLLENTTHYIDTLVDSPSASHNNDNGILQDTFLIQRGPGAGSIQVRRITTANPDSASTYEVLDTRNVLPTRHTETLSWNHLSNDVTLDRVGPEGDIRILETSEAKQRMEAYDFILETAVDEEDRKQQTRKSRLTKLVRSVLPKKLLK